MSASASIPIDISGLAPAIAPIRGSTFFNGLLLVIVAFAAILARNRWGNGISRFPGPFWASFTYLWRLRDAYVNGDKRPTMVQIHKQYGDIVRFGPKTLSFADPAAIPDIYGPTTNFKKSRWYVAFEAHGKGEQKANIFSTQDVHWHARYREAVAPGFRLDHFGAKEPAIDQLIDTLLRRLDRISISSKGKEPVDLPLNLQYFTFDVGGVVSFSKPYGFLEKQFDLDGIIASVRSGSMHLNRLAQVPLLQYIIDKNPAARYFGLIAPPMAFAKKYLPDARIAKQMEAPARRENDDILDQFVEAAQKSPNVVTTNEAVDLGLMVVVPASEAVRTAISVCAWQLLKHPAALKKLQKELDATFTDHSTIPSWEVCSNLPYLDACIKETFRIHPSTGFILERVVPAGGAFICGEYIPAGTVVGCLPWVLHRHKPTFGEDIEAFRPERWLEASREQREQMENLLCPFGIGSRLCLGREIGLFEVYKMTATLFTRYEVTLEKPKDDMKITWGNIVSVDFNAYLKKRGLANGNGAITNGHAA